MVKPCTGVPLFEQLAVVRETALFNTWAPFVNRSSLISQLAICEIVTTFNIHVPLFNISRDAVVHAYACDCVWESGKVLMLGKSVDENAPPDLNPGEEIPPYRKTLFHDRMRLKGFQAQIEVKNPTTARTTIIANIDPRTALPQVLINFVMKQMAGVLLHLLQNQAKVVARDPFCPHAVKIRQDTWFYRDWLVPRFQKYCQMMRWELPPIVALRDQYQEMEAPPKKRQPLRRLARSIRKRFSRSKKEKNANESTQLIRRPPPASYIYLKKRYEKWALARKKALAARGKGGALEGPARRRESHKAFGKRIAENVTLPLLLGSWSYLLGLVHRFLVVDDAPPSQYGLGQYLLMTFLLCVLQGFFFSSSFVAAFRLTMNKKTAEFGTLSETSKFLKSTIFTLAVLVTIAVSVGCLLGSGIASVAGSLGAPVDTALQNATLVQIDQAAGRPRLVAVDMDGLDPAEDYALIMRGLEAFDMSAVGKSAAALSEGKTAAALSEVEVEEVDADDGDDSHLGVRRESIEIDIDPSEASAAEAIQAEAFGVLDDQEAENDSVRMLEEFSSSRQDLGSGSSTVSTAPGSVLANATSALYTTNVWMYRIGGSLAIAAVVFAQHCFQE